MDIYNRLHPGLRRVIQNKGWRDLSDIQKTAFEPVFNGRDCIIQAPTAGGKTEAVLFPALTRAAAQRRDSVQILYLAPLRALLNNISERGRNYATACGLDCFKWHGDVSQKEKINAFNAPPHVLMTTPESLEAILLRKAGIEHFFRDLETIIIDEAHNFAGTDRGGHLAALLERIDRFTETPAQRVAMSATVGNPDEVLRWLAGGTERQGERVNVSARTEKLRDYQIHYFLDGKDANEDARERKEFKALKKVHSLLHDNKSIVFAGSRTKAESMATFVQQFNQMQPASQNLQVRTHHSSVSKFFREEAETLIQVKKEYSGGIDAIFCTSTLELGIDIGALDRVIECSELVSSSAFLQRVGRTGRRPGKAQYFRGICLDQESLLLLTAVTSLGLQGRAEAIVFPQRSFNLLAHQIICLCLQSNGTSAERIWNIVKHVHCFSGINFRELQKLIQFMVQNEYLRLVDEHTIVTGPRSEREYLGMNWRRLFAVFDTGPLYEVWNERKHVGNLDESFALVLAPSSIFVLGGINWVILAIDHKRKKISVSRTLIGTAPKWRAFRTRDVPFETAQETAHILFNSGMPDFLDDNAARTLLALQRGFRGLHWQPGHIVVSVMAETRARVLTFAGDKINRLLARLLTNDEFEVYDTSYRELRLRHTDPSADNRTHVSSHIAYTINRIRSTPPDRYYELEDSVSDLTRTPRFAKFSYCVPDDLWFKNTCDIMFDTRGLIREAKRSEIIWIDNDDIPNL